MRSTRRRPVKAWDIPGVEPPEPTRLSEAVWLGPSPDSLLDATFDMPVGPEARYEQAESISLASANSALTRARAGLERRRAELRPRGTTSALGNGLTFLDYEFVR